MHLNLLPVALVLAMTAYPLAAGAADCDAVLVPAVEASQSDRSFQLSYLRLVDQTEFERRKSGAGISIPIPVVDQIAKAAASWSDFQERRRRHFEKEQFALSETESRSHLKSYLPDSVVSAWAKCKLGRAGVAIYARSATRDVFVLRLEWAPPPNVDKVTATVSLSGGTINGASSASVELVGSGAQSWVVLRSAPSATIAIVNVGGYTDDVTVRRPDVLGQAVLYELKSELQPVATRSVCSSTMRTHHLDGVGCDPGCSDCLDGKHCRKDTTFVIVPSGPDWRLSPPVTRGECTKNIAGSCQWNAVGDLSMLRYGRQDEARIEVTRSFGSQNIGVRYCASESQFAYKDVKVEIAKWPLETGTTFDLELKAKRTLEVTWTDGRTDSLAPGEARGRLRLLAPTTSDGRPLYRYQVQPPQ